SPNDLREIEGLIERIDNAMPGPLHDLKVIRLKSALSDDLQLILRSAILEGILSPFTNLQGTVPGQAAVVPAVQPTGIPQANGAPGRQNTAHTLKFVTNRKELYEAGFLDDIRITSYPAPNLLIISAPPKTMELILQLVRELDVPPSAKAEITVFTLKKAD